MKKRSIYCGKFNRKIAITAIEGRKTIAELASEFPLHPYQISQWERQLLMRYEELITDKRRREQVDNTRQIVSYKSKMASLKQSLPG